MTCRKSFFLITLTILWLEYAVICLDIRKDAPYTIASLNEDYQIHWDVHREKRQVTGAPPGSVTATPGHPDGDATAAGNTQPAATVPVTSHTTLKPSPTTTLNPANATNGTVVLNNQNYYDVQVFSGTLSSHSDFWKDKSDYPGATKDGSLSGAHRTAYTFELSFQFPFYGHWVKKITVTTGGFLYTSDYIHQWLSATQYIAPLMANFDPNIGNDSHIYYMDTGNEFVVWWEHLYLNDDVEAGPFTFQVCLSSSGVITFAYKEVPKGLSALSTKDHPVEVGVADAFYHDAPISENITRRTIYEYDRVEIPLAWIAQNGAVLLNPRPTCLMIEDCQSCVSADIGFDCRWCTNHPEIRCSDGMDRYRQEWLASGCDNQEKIEAAQCPVPGNHSSTVDCDDGHGYDLDSAECVPCPQGYYRTQGQQDVCDKCPEHLVTDGTGGISADDCNLGNCTAGYYQDGPKCEPCPRGQFQPQRWRSSCEECPEGHTTTTTASVHATECFAPYPPLFGSAPSQKQTSLSFWSTFLLGLVALAARLVSAL